MKNNDIWTSLIKKAPNLSSMREVDDCSTPFRTENVIKQELQKQTHLEKSQDTYLEAD